MESHLKVWPSLCLTDFCTHTGQNINIGNLLLQHIRTAVVHPVEPEGVQLAEVEVLADDVVELWDFGSDSGQGFVHIEGERPVMHDGLVVVRRVLISDEVIIVFVEVVFKSCGKFQVHLFTPTAQNSIIRVKDTVGHDLWV